MKKINADLWSGLFMIAFAAFFYFQVDEAWTHFAGFFPLKLLPLMVIFGLLLLFKAWRNPSMVENFFKTQVNRTMVFAIIITSLWVISLDYIGFFISSFLAMFAMFVRFTPRAERTAPELGKLAFIAVAVVGCFYAVFVHLLYVALPTGLWFS